MAKETMKRYGFHAEGAQASGQEQSGGSITINDRSSCNGHTSSRGSSLKPPSAKCWIFVLAMVAFSIVYHERARYEFTFRSRNNTLNAAAEPDTTFRLGDRTFVAAAGDAALLATVEMDVEAGGSMTRYYESDLQILSDWLRDHCYIEADVTIPATVKAGFQGNLLGAEDVITEYLPDGRLVVTVLMPSPVIVSCCPDYSEIVRLSSETHFPNTAANLIELLAGLDAQLMANAREQAEAAGILELARTNANSRMVQIMKVLGADSVFVKFGNAGLNGVATNLEGRR